MLKSKKFKKMVGIIIREVKTYNNFNRSESATEEEAKNKDSKRKLYFKAVTTTLSNFTEVFNYDDFKIGYSVGGCIGNVYFFNKKGVETFKIAMN